MDLLLPLPPAPPYPSGARPSAYDELVTYSKAHPENTGLDKVVTLVSQVLNGGFSQWRDNCPKDAAEVSDYLRTLSVGRDQSVKIALRYVASMVERTAEASYETLDSFDEEFYDIDEMFCACVYAATP